MLRSSDRFRCEQLFREGIEHGCPQSQGGLYDDYDRKHPDLVAIGAQA